MARPFMVGDPSLQNPSGTSGRMRKETGWNQTGTGLVGGISGHHHAQGLLPTLLWFQHLHLKARQEDGGGYRRQFHNDVSV